MKNHVLVVQGGLIEYPVGFLKMAYRASFTFEFYVFPAVSTIYNIYFPKKKPWFIKTLYIIAIPGVMTISEVYLEKNTELIKYLHWTWYWSFLTMTATLLLSYGYYL
ncbi:CBO0543 family protein [Paenibacillus glycanilyticus]|uniref:CBO0543 family protein n=1 Tax=Paenibacillus glycanilyticus TaxID=126569 RepID=UPI0035A25295